MGLEKILSISGKPGLYKILAQTRTGIVAESLLDKRRMSVNVQNNISILSEIAIYTLTEEVPLKEVFLKIMKKESGAKTAINHKDSKDKLEEYFFEVLPDYDEDRVYASDIKKVIQWYNLLHEHDLLSELEEVKVEENKTASSKDIKEEESKTVPSKKVKEKKSKTVSSEEE